MTEAQQHMARLEQEIAELRARLPKHSTPPAMLLRLEELEDELARLQVGRDDGAAPQPEQ